MSNPPRRLCDTEPVQSRREREAIARLEAIAWEALQDGRKAPITQPAGPGFADPTYELSLQWLDTRARLQAAQTLWGDSAASSRVQACRPMCWT